MKLVMDVGNTRVKWGRVDGGRLAPGAFFEHAGAMDPAMDEAWMGLERPESVLICSVAAAEVNQRLERWLMARWDLRPDWFIAAAETLGITNGYARPDQLGNDRWAALVGARGESRGAVGVIDCGTAATLDVVDAGDRHRGGLILPGLALARQSLLDRTARIRDIVPTEPGILGHSTAECVANGTLLGLAGALERCVAEIEETLPGIIWLATGGAWPVLAAWVDRSITYEPELVLKGLVRVLE